MNRRAKKRVFMLPFSCCCGGIRPLRTAMFTALTKVKESIFARLGVRRFVGKDVFGNSYFEGMGKRWLELPKGQSDYDPQKVEGKNAGLANWRSWLTWTRGDPPTLPEQK